MADYDIIIVGAGPAGLTAAIYALRAKKSVLLIEKAAMGGQMTFSPLIENYPGMQALSGNELADKMVEHALSLGADVELDEVTGLEDKGDFKVVKAVGGDYEAMAVIVATGTFLNGLVDRFELRYLYIVIPMEGEQASLVNVCSATSEAERAAGEEDLPLLYVSYAYPREEIQRYIAAWDKPGISFFEEYSDYGRFYTACLPLRASDGESVALLCADLSMQTLRQTVDVYTFYGVLLMVCIYLVGLAAMTLREQMTAIITQGFLDKMRRRKPEL